MVSVKLWNIGQRSLGTINHLTVNVVVFPHLCNYFEEFNVIITDRNYKKIRPML